MGLFQNFLDSFKQKSPTGNSISSPIMRGPANLYGQGKLELQNDPMIFSVITRLANVISAMPVKLYDQNENAIRNQDIYRLVAQKPNPNYNAFDLWNKAETDRNEFGNAYIFIQYGMYETPVALWNVDRSYVNPFINTDDNTLWYGVTGSDKTMYVPASQMIHLKHATGSNRLMGISPIDVLKGAYDYNEAFAKFSLNEMSKRDGFTVKFDHNVDDERKKATVKNIQSFIQDNSGALFSEPGVEVDTIDRKIATSDVSKNDDTYIRRVANAFNVPLVFLNSGSQGSGYRDSEEHMIGFVQGTVLPIIRQYEAELNMKLLTDSQKTAGFYFSFDFNYLLRGNTAARTAFYQALLRSGGMTPNEVREMEGLPKSDQDGANDLWVSGDLYKIEMTPNDRKGVGGKEDNNVLQDESDVV